MNIILKRIYSIFRVQNIAFAVLALSCSSGNLVGVDETGTEENFSSNAQISDAPETNANIEIDTKENEETEQEEEITEVVEPDEQLPTEPKDEVIDDIPVIVLDGLQGGHFDADTFENGQRLEHVHAYDDKNSTDRIIYLGANNQATGALSLRQSQNVSQSTVFTIELGNAELSKGAMLKINGDYYTWDNLPPANTTYSLSPNSNADVTLSELAVIYSLDAIAEGDISCSEPGDTEDDAVSRNGSLRVMLKTPNNALLWEGVTYWHNKDCVL